MKKLNDLVTEGFHLNEQNLNLVKTRMKEHLEKKIPNNVFDWVVSDLRKIRLEDCECSVTLLHFSYVVEFCNFIYCLSVKCGSNYMKKLHKQTALMFKLGEYDIYDFYGAYFRLVCCLEDAGKSPVEYIPDELIASDDCIDNMYSYWERRQYELNMPRYAADVVSIGENNKILETHFECNGEKYAAIVPKTYMEIVEESSFMKNCLATRIPQYVDGEWVYVFIRDMNKPDIPFIDACIRTGVDGGSKGPKWVVLKDHVDVGGTPAGEVFNTWYNMMQKQLESVYRAADVIALRAAMKQGA